MKTDYTELLERALDIARIEYPDLDRAAGLAAYTRLLNQARRHLTEHQTLEQRLHGLNHLLFKELGYGGNQEDYYNPQNSCINAVLETRKGMPITLGVLYISLARDLGLPVYGVSFPGHFIVACSLGDREVYLDPFHGGRRLAHADLLELLEAYDYPELADEELLPELLQPASRDQILVRMLRNLKAIYFREGMQQKALQTVSTILRYEPDSMDELRDRGLLYFHMERIGPALLDLTRYIQTAPDAEDAETVRKILLDIHGDDMRIH